MLARSNIGSANTRKINKALGSLKGIVSVKSMGYCGGGATVSVPAGEIEILMSARQAVMDIGFKVSEIKTYKNLNQSVFYAERGAA